MNDFDIAINKLRALQKLPVGWNYGASGPLSRHAFSYATLVLRYLFINGATRFDVLPSHDNGATILAEHGDDVAEIVVYTNGKFDLCIERQNGTDIEEEDLRFGELVAVLGEEGWQSLKSSGSQTHAFTVMSTSGLLGRPSPRMVPEPRSSTFHVSRNRDGQFVITSADFIQESEENPPFSRELAYHPLLMAHG